MKDIVSFLISVLANTFYDIIKAIQPRGFFTCRKAIRRIKEEGIVIFYPNREVLLRIRGIISGRMSQNPIGKYIMSVIGFLNHRRARIYVRKLLR